MAGEFVTNQYLRAVWVRNRKGAGQLELFVRKSMEGDTYNYCQFICYLRSTNDTRIGAGDTFDR